MKALATAIGLFITSQAFPQASVQVYQRTLRSVALGTPTVAPAMMQPIPQSFYATHLGFFCKQELKLQQQRIPVTFRLGSMDYCNRLEQKPGYR
jgi:hypothetical protein